MNSLVDPEMIRALYDASRAGVHIRLNVRGICTLRPGVKGLSDTITVVSIIGRHLEHGRIFVFHNGGEQEAYLASADWMTRNLDKRIELMFPVESPSCQRKVLEALDCMFRDNVKARHLSPTGQLRVPPRFSGDERFEAQTHLRDLADRENAEEDGNVFEPLGEL